MNSLICLKTTMLSRLSQITTGLKVPKAKNLKKLAPICPNIRPVGKIMEAKYHQKLMKAMKIIIQMKKKIR